MRTRNALDRLAAAGGPLLAEADSLIDDGDEQRILARILASDRPTVAVHRRLRPALLLAGVVVAAAIAVIATGTFDGPKPRAGKTSAQHSVALTGPRIEMAGYRFRTPAGFKLRSTACEPPVSAHNPVTNGFAAAASADGGCLEAAFITLPGATLPKGVAVVPTGAAEVDIGNYKGYFASADVPGKSMLYVELPNGMGDGRLVYLVLFAHGLTEDQLIAVAETGLPGLPLKPTATTGTEATG
jgi:hypothetical protein